MDCKYILLRSKRTQEAKRYFLNPSYGKELGKNCGYIQKWRMTKKIGSGTAFMWVKKWVENGRKGISAMWRKPSLISCPVGHENGRRRTGCKGRVGSRCGCKDRSWSLLIPLFLAWVTGRMMRFIGWNSSFLAPHISRKRDAHQSELPGLFATPYSFLPVEKSELIWTGWLWQVWIHFS